MSPSEPLTIDDLRRPGAPATLTVPQLKSVLGNVSTDALYESIARDRAPWRVLRVGRKILIPTSDVLRSLGLEPEPSPDQDS